MGPGSTPRVESLAKSLQEVGASVSQAASRLEKSGIQQPAPTIVGSQTGAGQEVAGAAGDG